MSWHPCCCGVSSSCCADTIPTTIHVTLNSATCGCEDGLTFTLTYNSTLVQWEGSYNDGCDGNLHLVTFKCVSTGNAAWQMFITSTLIGPTLKGCRVLGSPNLSASASCDPLNVVFTGFTISDNAHDGTCSCDGDALTYTVTD